MEAEKAILDLRYLMWLSINIIDEYIIRYNLVKDFETFLLCDDLLRPDCNFLLDKNKIRAIHDCTENESDFTEDIVTEIKRKLKSQNKNPISDNMSITDFSQVYLFFDYDFQNKNLNLEILNSQLQEMLEFFSDETDNGKLYINYPMLGSIKCTQKLPDEHFFEYNVSRTECFDFIQFQIDKNSSTLCLINIAEFL